MRKLFGILQVIFLFLLCNFYCEAQNSRSFLNKKNYPNRYKSARKSKTNPKSSFSTFSSKTSYDHIISITANYNFPLTRFSEIYYPAPGFKAGYIKRENNLALWVQLGTVNFKPKSDIFYLWQEGWEELGTVKYSNYKLITLSGTLGWYLPITDRFEIMTGLEMGYYLTDFQYEIESPGEIITGDEMEKKGAISPVFGFEYSISNNISLALAGQYHVFFSIGTTDLDTPDDHINYNENLGNTDHYFSTNLSLIYKF